jgi:hypothetical protein
MTERKNHFHADNPWDRREKHAENAIAIDFLGKHVPVRSGVAIEDYLSRIKYSTGEIRVMETEKFAEVFERDEYVEGSEYSVLAVYTDGKIIRSTNGRLNSSAKDMFLFDGKESDPTYIAWVTINGGGIVQGNDRMYYLATTHHTKEDVAKIIQKEPGNKLVVVIESGPEESEEENV